MHVTLSCIVEKQLCSLIRYWKFECKKLLMLSCIVVVLCGLIVSQVYKIKKRFGTISNVYHSINMFYILIHPKCQYTSLACVC